MSNISNGNIPITNMDFKILNVPRGQKGAPPLSLDLTELYKAEGRLIEVSVVNNATASELMGYFNHVTNLTTKYIAWLEFELLQANKRLAMAKATVILDKMPEEIEKYKAAGLKSNDDFRSALITRDPDCQSAQDTLDQLAATKMLLSGKADSFKRAYYAVQRVRDSRSSSPTPNFHGGFTGNAFNGDNNDV